MSSGPVATATVRVIPDTTGFRAELQTQLKAATAGVTATVQTQVAGTAAAASAAAISGVGGSVRGASGGGAGGVNALSKESQALRGSLIGLSRVTPVTVFGLGLYGTAAVAAGTAIKGAIHSTADFEHQLYVFQATTNATAEQMELISDKAKALGADLSLPSTSAGDAALAMTELAKAGLTVDDTLAGSTGVLQLAAAAQLDVASAAQFVATQLNAFGLSGAEATHVADLLAGASIAAQGDIRDFGTSFQQVSAVAKQADVSVETTTGALVGLAKAGLRGADGGTSLRTALLRLTPTTKQAGDYQKALGIELDKNKTIGEQLPQLLDQYKASLQALTPIQRQQALTQIFGQDAYRAAAILIEGGSRALAENTRQANQSGAANRLAQANAKGLSGAFNGLKSNLDTLGIVLGEFVSGPLEELVRGLSDSVAGAVNLAEALPGLKKELDELVDNRFFDFLSADTLGIGDVVKGGVKKSTFLGPAFLGLLNPDAKEAPGTLPPGTGPGGPGGLTSGIAERSAAAQAAIRARIKALEEERKKKKALPGDTIAPNKLAIAQLNAQLNEDLKAELKADLAIEAYFKDRLKLAKKGSTRYREILNAQQSAHAAAVSVQDQINSEAESAANERKAKANEAQRIAEQAERDAARAAKDLFNLQRSRLDLTIAEAGLTKPIADDIRANRAEIRFYQAQIKRIEAIKRRRKLTLDEQQAVVDYRTAIVGLRSTIKSLKDDSGGFSLNDLFKEALNQFNEFGSNVSSSPLTPGGARGTFAAAIASQNPKLTQADREKIKKASTTNELLEKILEQLQKTDPGFATVPGDSQVGRLTARQAAGLASRRVGGA